MPALIDLDLFAVSALCTIAMAIAWRDLDRPRYALTWGVAFALLGALWAIDLVGRMGLADVGVCRVLSTTMAALASAAYAVGFRQRALRPPRCALLIGTALMPPLCVCALDALGFETIALAPLHLYNAAMLALAAATLVGRRRAERTAQVVAYVGLLILTALCAALFVTKVHAAFVGKIDGIGWLGMALLPLLPATVTGIGLVSIFLLAADQADQTRRLATTDMLSGLLNRRGFEEASAALLAAAKVSGRQVSLALIDIDRFKAINDSFGHQLGDAVIAQVARLLGEQAGRRDLVARLGGEEFAVLMADADATAALCAAEVMRERIATAAFDLPDERAVTGSFGIVEVSTDHQTLADVLAAADTALYEAKSAGRNRVALFSGTAAR